jgi:hypothetical protein
VADYSHNLLKFQRPVLLALEVQLPGLPALLPDQPALLPDQLVLLPDQLVLLLDPLAGLLLLGLLAGLLLLGLPVEHLQHQIPMWLPSLFHFLNHKILKMLK